MNFRCVCVCKWLTLFWGECVREGKKGSEIERVIGERESERERKRERRKRKISELEFWQIQNGLQKWILSVTSHCYLRKTESESEARRTFGSGSGRTRYLGINSFCLNKDRYFCWFVAELVNSHNDNVSAGRWQNKKNVDRKKQVWCHRIYPVGADEKKANF